jgi:hypothetical protein
VAVWYNKICREKQLAPNYISIKINGKNSQCQKTIIAATHYYVGKSISELQIQVVTYVIELSAGNCHCKMAALSFLL